MNNLKLNLDIGDFLFNQGRTIKETPLETKERLKGMSALEQIKEIKKLGYKTLMDFRKTTKVIF